MKNKRMKQGILLTFLVLLLLAAGCGKQEENQPFTYRAPSKKAETKETTAEKETEYVIQDIDMEEETITLLEEGSDKRIRCRYNLATRFLDKYDNSYSSVHFVPGQVVKLGDKTENAVLKSIRLSDTVWNYEEVENYQIDPERGTFEIGKSIYQITEDTQVFSGDAQIDWEAVGKDDVLHVVGREKEIVSVMVTTGHGAIRLVNTDVFKGSMICIGNEIFTNITGDMKIEVPEGTYPITVANNGYGGTAEFTVNRNETTVVDLEQLKGKGPKTCKLTLKTDIAGAQVYIDGEQITVGKTFKVTYGSHTLSVIAEGYESWEKTLVVNSKSATIELTLEKEGSTDATEETQNSSMANSSGTESTNTNNNASGSSSSSESNSTSSSDTKDTEVDYLTTISNMLNNLLD